MMIRHLLAVLPLVALAACAGGAPSPAARVSDFGADIPPVSHHAAHTPVKAVRYGVTTSGATDPNAILNWCSFSGTGKAGCIQTATAVASAVNARVLATGGASTSQILTAPSIAGGTAASTDVSAALALAAGATTALTPAKRHSQTYSVYDFGAKCDGATDDAAAINAALTAAGTANQGGTVLLGATAMCRFGRTLTVPDGVNLAGLGLHSSQLKPLSTAFSPQISVAGANSRLSTFQLLAGASDIGYPSNGSVAVSLSTSASPFMNTIEGVWIDGPCIGVDMAGNNNTVRSSYINFVTGGSGCYGIRVGHLTTKAGTTDPRILDTTIATDQSTSGRPDADLQVEDAGGLYLVNDDFLYAKRGTIIKPGAKQYVTWLFGINTALGDTNGSGGLLIDTADASAQIKGLEIAGSWTSNAQGPG
ncbi:glycosyl hydrolase family 28-related protein, partial [Gluconobacter oxydans]|uniref:glycosyl hydrolase family 28-related protein n=1 Tax=Gluconobacter oxydans TaxID=442 RepID=UPI001C20BB16